MNYISKMFKNVPFFFSYGSYLYHTVHTGKRFMFGGLVVNAVMVSEDRSSRPQTAKKQK